MSHPAPKTQTMEPAYMQGLNPSQKEAVETTEGPLLVLAGAGTGKTRVLTTRLAHIIFTGKAYPSQVLAVTFTNKAALEMKHKISQILGDRPVEGWWLGTFHALSARILRRHAELAGLSSNFTVIDPDDQTRLIKQLMEAENVDTKKWPPKVIANIISQWKDRGNRPQDLGPDETGDLANGKSLRLYKLYQERLRLINACDFGDLLLHVIHILKNPENRHILDEYHNQFRYIMVDEYQDTNVAQYLWLRLLVQGSGNVCCVGDDDQSIYGWRGAEIGNILRFEKDFSGARIIRLEQNYRSTNTILNAAGGLIANNRGRHAKTLWSEQGQGEKLTVKGLWDGPAEARWIGEEVERLRKENISLNGMAILVRAGFQMREFEERFIQLGLPYKVIGGPRFYERQEIRDALAYLRVTAQPDDDLALERILNVPKRGLGDTTVKTLYAHARARQISLYRATGELVQSEELKPKIRDTLQSLLQDFNRWRSQIPSTEHSILAGIILDESGYTDMWQSAKTPDAAGRLENLKEFVSAMAEFDSLAEFLEHVALVLDNQESRDGEFVTIMTLHAAKGLEFNYVFLPGWEEGLFPSQRTIDENGLAGLEEERRLAYVGITRAKEKSFISFVANRRMYGNWINAIPSRFIDEIPEETIERDTEMGTHYQARSPHWDTSGMTAPDRRRRIMQEITIKPGATVTHEKFGTGKVIHVDGHKLDIEFENGSRKRVLDSFIDILE